MDLQRNVTVAFFIPINTAFTERFIVVMIFQFKFHISYTRMNHFMEVFWFVAFRTVSTVYQLYDASHLNCVPGCHNQD